jgi:dTDP-4-amino-4,6-dideoxygalactose transaminase
MFHCTGLQKGDFPVSELAATPVLDVPVYPELTVDQQESNVRAIREFFGG